MRPTSDTRRPVPGKYVISRRATDPNDTAQQEIPQVKLSGNRVVALDNPIHDDFGDNFVSTSKYDPLTFLPEFPKDSSCHATV